MEAFFNSDGTRVEVHIQVLSNGVHTDPDSWPITNDPAIVLSSHPAATKTVTKIRTGYYTVVWTGLSPALAHGDVVRVAIDGAISGTAWSTWTTPIQVVWLPLHTLGTNAPADWFNAASISADAGAEIADEVQSRELTLTAAYDAAKTAASQTSVNDIPTVAEFEARTLASAAYATAAQINSLNVNTRANISVPIEIETPDSGTQVYKVRMFLFDVVGNMESPDSEPTVALVNAAGTDRASRLSVVSNPSTGVYSWDYTATDDDAEEQLNWTFTVVEGGLTRVYPATSYVVEETAYRFTSTDRATLNSRASQTSLDAEAVKTAAILEDTGTTIPAQITGLNNLSASQVNAEVLDVLNVDTHAELSSPPAATSSLKDKLTWLFMWMRNKSTETATERKLYADDTTTIVSTETVSDDGTTFTKGEAS